MAPAMRTAVVSLLILAAAWPAQAQEETPRKVYTNDDLAPPSSRQTAAAPEAPATEPPVQSPQQQGEAGRAALSLTELGRATELQEVFRRSHQELVAMLDREGNPVRRERWDSMIVCLSTLLQLNQRHIEELRQANVPKYVTS